MPRRILCLVQVGPRTTRRQKLFHLLLGLVLVLVCLQTYEVTKAASHAQDLVASHERRTFNSRAMGNRMRGQYSPLGEPTTSSSSSITKATTTTERTRTSAPPSAYNPSGPHAAVEPDPATSALRRSKPITGNRSDTACPFVSVDPFDSFMMFLVPKRRPLNCSVGIPSVVYLDGDYLRVNISKLNGTLEQKDFFCRYTRLELSEYNDSYLKREKWSNKFSEQPMRVSEKDEHLYVQCIRKSNSSIIGETFKSRVIEKPEMEKIRDADYIRHVHKNSPSETMSVLVVGMDAMSKQNLERTMPKTRNYVLEHLHAKELNMFNKVGDNTFPNVIPLLSGLRDTDLGQYNWTENDYFDVIDELFLWRDYQKAGYRTSCTLDVVNITAFHYLKKGWRHPTFDFYSRPLSLEMRSFKKHKYRNKAGANCIGDVPEVEILQDYTLQLLKKYNTKSRPYFFYNFFSELTHDYQEDAAKGDDMYLRFFQQLKQSNLLNNTVVMFYSDHGNRFGSARRTFNGKVETNTPFVFFMFPPWFEKKYPEAMAAFRRNQNRLTTFFDLHQTLKDLLTFTGRTTTASLRSTAISLFDEIPTARNCQHAGIPVEFCNCKEFSNATVPQKVYSRIVNILLRHIVSRTSYLRNLCAVLSLHSVKSILTIKTDTASSVYYQIIIETSPGGGVYEGLVKYDTVTGAVDITGTVIRLNLYRGQDWCVHSLYTKPYCFCKTW